MRIDDVRGEYIACALRHSVSEGTWVIIRKSRSVVEVRKRSVDVVRMCRALRTKKEFGLGVSSICSSESVANDISSDVERGVYSCFIVALLSG